MKWYILLTALFLSVSFLVPYAMALDEPVISKSRAFEFVFENVLNGVPKGKRVYGTGEVVKAKTEIKAFDKIVKSPPFDGWFFFVDDYPC